MPMKQPPATPKSNTPRPKHASCARYCHDLTSALIRCAYTIRKPDAAPAAIAAVIGYAAWKGKPNNFGRDMYWTAAIDGTITKKPSKNNASPILRLASGLVMAQAVEKNLGTKHKFRVSSIVHACLVSLAPVHCSAEGTRSLPASGRLVNKISARRLEENFVCSHLMLPPLLPLKLRLVSRWLCRDADLGDRTVVSTSPCKKQQRRILR